MKDATINFLETLCRNLADAATLVRKETEQVITEGDHVEVIKHYNQLRYATELIKESRKAIDDISDALSREGVPMAMKAANVKTITIEGVGRVTVAHRYSCSMLDKEAGFQWLRKNGHGGLITETVNSSSLAAFAKSILIDEGKELPDDIFKTGQIAYTSITKVK